MHAALFAEQHFGRQATAFRSAFHDVEERILAEYRRARNEASRLHDAARDAEIADAALLAIAACDGRRYGVPPLTQTNAGGIFDDVEAAKCVQIRYELDFISRIVEQLDELPPPASDLDHLTRLSLLDELARRADELVLNVA